MTTVYLVKSGQLIDFSGWEWLNLRCFTDYAKAKEYADMAEMQIKNEDRESVEIEELPLE